MRASSTAAGTGWRLRELGTTSGHYRDVTTISTLTDRELWRSACNGQPQDFGLIFDRHGATVYNHLARRTDSWSTAEDITSVVFLEAWRRRADIELVHDSALPWLLGVANKVVQQRRRSVRRHRDALNRLPPGVVEPDPADQVVARLDGELKAKQVLAAFRRLPTRDQDVIALCVWQGLDYAAAAIALGVPIGTVRSRLSRARTRLADLSDFHPVREEQA
jgi:RNA polymerase sigma factor (sigma-70 family)